MNSVLVLSVLLLVSAAYGVDCPSKHLASDQNANCDMILSKCSSNGVSDKHQQAYILATTQHESIYRPIEEWGKGKGKPYGKPDPETGKIYYGRGFVQLTWKYNYEKFAKLLGVDLVWHPEYALHSDVAGEVIVLGMRDGLFTGRRLSDYIHGSTVDYYNARRIVNGLDRASTIAGYAEDWADCLDK